ncbi:MAG: acetoin utilization protein AcuC [Chloroflexi bacterium]|nr:acetoin utilization protein AcuC [Chloroflexota bacterium]MCL5075916.1 acetoin utilization protein AcuC [Chloroflexota bacterium]
MSKMVIIYGDKFLDYQLGGNHPLNPLRLKLACSLMRHLGLLQSPGVSVAEPVVASEKEVLLFHSQRYYDYVVAACGRGWGWLDIGDTPAFKGGVEASLLVVGASLQAASMVWQGGVDHAFNLGGGLHHAYPERASGFCIFNDPAIAIAWLKQRGAKRIVYIDIDAHHGDGVMYGFYADAGLLDIDFHEDGRYLFPGSGDADELGEGEAKGCKVNVPLPPYCGDESFLYAFRELVPPLLKRYQPEIILVQCGADGHAGDPLTHMRLTNNSYREAARIVHQLAHELCGGRLVLFGGGGYNYGSVAVCWTTIASVVAETAVPEQIPQAWRREFEKTLRQSAPSTMAGEPGGEEGLAGVRETVSWFKEQILK